MKSKRVKRVGLGGTVADPTVWAQPCSVGATIAAVNAVPDDCAICVVGFQRRGLWAALRVVRDRLLKQRDGLSRAEPRAAGALRVTLGHRHLVRRLFALAEDVV